MLVKIIEIILIIKLLLHEYTIMHMNCIIAENLEILSVFNNVTTEINSEKMSACQIMVYIKAIKEPYWQIFSKTIIYYQKLHRWFQVLNTTKQH